MAATWDSFREVAMLSSAMIWVTYNGDQVVDAYSRSGLTYTLKLKARNKLAGLLDRKQRSISDLHWLALLTMSVICGWKDSLESIVTPRSFAVSTVTML